MAGCREMNPLHTIIIGIDCAVQPENRGVAVGVFDGKKCSIVLPGAKTDTEIAALVLHYRRNSNRVLIAIDAPLGWPAEMGANLAIHEAGQVLDVTSDLLFRRETDRFVKEKAGKQSLDVGADRIARTAHAALKILSATGSMPPLAWKSYFEDVAVIEVYPAATLKIYGLPHVGYKESSKQPVRRAILNGLQAKLTIIDDRPLIDDADVLDAVVCVLAGVDFLSDACYQPEDVMRANKEGWIWIRVNNIHSPDCPLAS